MKDKKIGTNNKFTMATTAELMLEFGKTNDEALDIHNDIEKITTPRIMKDDIFNKYLINIGIRSNDYLYDHKIILDNVNYFKKCYDEGLSAYKALLFLPDYINGEYDI